MAQKAHEEVAGTAQQFPSIVGPIPPVQAVGGGRVER